MDKKEFLDILYTQLSGQLPEGIIAGHIQYYRNYIDEELQKGRSEADILGELGDPRLIARTLLDTNDSSSAPYTSSEDEPYGQDNAYDPGSHDRHIRHRTYKLDLTTWYGKLIVILIAALVIFLLCTILSVLIPVMLVAGTVMYLISYFKKHK